MLFGPSYDLTLLDSSMAAGTRPAAANGTSVTPAQNAWGSWATAITATAARVHKLRVMPHGWGISTAARDTLIQVGWDPAGGAAFTAWCTLQIGPAAIITNIRACIHELLVNFPAGSAIGVRASVNTATLTAGRVILDAFGYPSPSHAWANAGRATDLGINTATSAGATVTPGTVLEGAWAEIGTLTADAFAFEFGIGFNDAAVVGGITYVDFGIGTPSAGGGTGSDARVIVKDWPVFADSAEQISRPSCLTYARAASGLALWCRMQNGTGAAPTNVSASAVAFHH